MIIKDNRYGEFDVCLCDDGTMDTVVSVSHGLIETKEYRYDCEYASWYRDEDTGAMTEEGFKELAEESLNAFIEDHLV